MLMTIWRDLRQIHRSRNPRAEAFTASASCPAGRWDHAATDYFAAGIVFHNYEQDRQDASQRVLQTVRSIRLVLDAEIQRMTGGLEVLALTTSLLDGEATVDFLPRGVVYTVICSLEDKS